MFRIQKKGSLKIQNKTNYILFISCLNTTSTKKMLKQVGGLGRRNRRRVGKGRVFVFRFQMLYMTPRTWMNNIVLLIKSEQDE